MSFISPPRPREYHLPQLHDTFHNHMTPSATSAFLSAPEKPTKCNFSLKKGVNSGLKACKIPEARWLPNGCWLRKRRCLRASPAFAWTASKIVALI